jgi:Skp family chaperone for outer membrane proteins
MSQSPCSQIEARIQKIERDLQDIDDQLHALEVEGLDEQHPQTYIELQKKVDHLNKKKRELQDAWNRALTDLADCRSH